MIEVNTEEGNNHLFELYEHTVEAYNLLFLDHSLKYCQIHGLNPICDCIFVP